MSEGDPRFQSPVVPRWWEVGKVTQRIRRRIAPMRANSLPYNERANGRCPNAESSNMSAGRCPSPFKAAGGVDMFAAQSAPACVASIFTDAFAITSSLSPIVSSSFLVVHLILTRNHSPTHHISLLAWASLVPGWPSSASSTAPFEPSHYRFAAAWITDPGAHRQSGPRSPVFPTQRAPSPPPLTRISADKNETVRAGQWLSAAG
jgi:hypothetical protein